MSVATVMLFLGGLGGSEVAVIMLVVLLFFGAKRIPELAKGLGQGLRELKNATNQIKQEVESSATKTEK